MLVTARSPEELAESPWYPRLTAITGASSLIAEIARRHGFPGSVRVVGLGVEPVPAELLDRVVKSRTIERLVTAYGMTECACYSTAAVLHDRGAPCTGSPSPNPPTPKLNDIGRPIANTRVYVLSRDRQPVPIGVPGELYIGGEGLARGYLNRPELTAERFIPSPFAPDETLYRTGDRVRWSPEGTLEFLGRVDEQVKLRGFRIELGEIEAILDRHEEVARSAAMVRGAPDGGQRLVAYWTPRGPRTDPSPTSTATSAFLPGYMIPSPIVRLASLPLGPTGKVDRKSLPEPPGSSRMQSGPPVAGRDRLERRLVEIWSDLLQVKDLGIHDDFFRLGGHSLLALRLLAKVESELDLRISLPTLYQHPTIAGIARRLNDRPLESTRPVVKCLQRGSGSPVLVLMPTVFGHDTDGARLMPFLPPDLAIHALELVGDQPYWEGCETLADMARGFVRRSSRPSRRGLTCSSAIRSAAGWRSRWRGRCRRPAWRRSASSSSTPPSRRAGDRPGPGSHATFPR